MNELEWRAMLSRIDSDVAGIVRAQRVLTEVHDEMSKRTQNPIEEDFIFADGYGHNSGAPRTLEIDGVEIQIRVLHRRGLKQSDIKGADLLYEIEGKKFVLIQYKSPNKQARVRKDSPQLKELIAACPNPCPPPLNDPWPTCGAWYAIRGKKESFYMPACFADSVFGRAASRKVDRFFRGVSADVFNNLFGRCWTGARIDQEEFSNLDRVAAADDRVLFSVLQRGSFGRW